MHNCSNILKFILFADDTNLIASDKSWEHLENKLNNELSKLTDWFTANKLPLNAKKPNYLIFGSKKRLHNTLNILINNERLLQVKTTKFLGVY